MKGVVDITIYKTKNRKEKKKNTFKKATSTLKKKMTFKKSNSLKK